MTDFFCKPPIYRTTPFGREITDMLVAVNRSYNKSDYIPTIAWGATPGWRKNLPVGQKIRVEGRIQSREYEKLLESGRGSAALPMRFRPLPCPCRNRRQENDDFNEMDLATNPFSFIEGIRILTG